jgi:hypothetical protein
MRRAQRSGGAKNTNTISRGGRRGAEAQRIQIHFTQSARRSGGAENTNTISRGVRVLEAETWQIVLISPVSAPPPLRGLRVKCILTLH